MLKINGVYRHYKGKYYRVITIAKHTETDEKLVVYEALYGEHDVWCRPLNMWSDMIEIDGKQLNRFEYIEEYNG